MRPRAVTAGLLLATSILPHAGPVVCTVVGGSGAHPMESCPDASAPMPGAGHHGCDLARCATAPVAPPLAAQGISLLLPAATQRQVPVREGSASVPRAPLTPPPIA